MYKQATPTLSYPKTEPMRSVRRFICSPVRIDKNIYEKSKRNVLTSGVAACYPFASYEMSDKDGIMIGVNKANSSLVIIDIFNSLKYKNANIAIFGTSGSGKTFLMQLMALRMRQKNIQVFIIAPDKGHEFARACNNIGGEFIQISPSSSNWYFLDNRHPYIIFFCKGKCSLC